MTSAQIELQINPESIVLVDARSNASISLSPTAHPDRKNNNCTHLSFDELLQIEMKRRSVLHLSTDSRFTSLCRVYYIIIFCFIFIYF